ncbi:MAG: hypothetical protein JWO50_296 [Candidatus Kaiserbacteria bacterium]|nr:hypothetical protein [Candidatus Kaiserbacteria bacterium]
MGCNRTQVESLCGKGLSSDVINIARRLTNVAEISLGRTRKYVGKPKIRFPERGSPENTLVLHVCDADDGERPVIIRTSKPGAIARILCKKLCGLGIPVVRERAA